MKITELLREATQAPKKPIKAPSALPSAPSIDDEPDEIDQDVIDDEEEIAGIEEIKKIAGDMGKDLYAITIDWSSPNTTINHLSRISKDLPGLKFAVKQMKNEVSDRDPDIIAATIVNARNGEVFTFNSGESTTINPAEGDDWLDLVDQDQATVLNKLTNASDKYVRAIDSNSSNDRKVEAREKVKDILNSMGQPAHSPAWSRSGLYSSEQEYLDAQAKREARWKKIHDLENAEAAKKAQGAGRGKR